MSNGHRCRLPCFTAWLYSLGYISPIGYIRSCRWLWRRFGRPLRRRGVNHCQASPAPHTVGPIIKGPCDNTKRAAWVVRNFVFPDPAAPANGTLAFFRTTYIRAVRIRPVLRFRNHVLNSCVTRKFNANWYNVVVLNRSGCDRDDTHRDVVNV